MRRLGRDLAPFDQRCSDTSANTIGGVQRYRH